MMVHFRSTMILLFCAIPLLTTASKAQAQCYNSHFFRYLDMKLRCGVFKTLAVLNFVECQTRCAAELSCFSVNFYQNENKTHVCEMIKGSKNSFAKLMGCFVQEKGSEHDELMMSGFCLSSVSGCKQSQLTRKVLPGNWYQLGSSAFKIFEQKKSHVQASAVCSANGGALATIASKNEDNFVGRSRENPNPNHRTNLKTHETLETGWFRPGCDDFVVPKEDQWAKRKWIEAWMIGKDALFNRETVWEIKKPISPLHGSLVSEYIDEYNISVALHFPGTAGSYATTPAWGISTMTFSISVWFKLESCNSYYFYSYWSSPYLFCLRVSHVEHNCNRLSFSARKKLDSHSDLFYIQGGQFGFNQWIHAVSVWNRATKQATLYQDGLQIAQSIPLTTSELDFPAPIRPVFDVGYKRDKDLPMKGWLKELLIFDRAVTSEEVNIIKDATSMPDPTRAWIGAPHRYLNMAPVTQPKTNCLSTRAWGTYQWEEVPCNRSMEFICKKPA